MGNASPVAVGWWGVRPVKREEVGFVGFRRKCDVRATCEGSGEAHGTLAPSTVNYHPFPHESQLTHE